MRRIWVKDGCTKVTRLSADGNAQENTIITKDRTYIWNDGNTQYYEGLNGSIYADDVLQIPTYENILNENEAEIITASYENRSGEPCVYVQVADNEYGGIRGYWVSLDSGLLVAAEVYEKDELVYRMTASAYSSFAPEDLHFQLPNGYNVLLNG